MTPKQHHPTPEERDERVILPLPPETAISALLAVEPDSEPVEGSDGLPRNVTVGREPSGS